MLRTIQRLALVAIWLTSISNCFAQAPSQVHPAANQSAQFDEEHIVDVSKLKEKMLESTKPLQERIEKSQLQQKFDKVFEVLKEEEVDSKKLKSSLEDLEQGIDAFRSDWDSTIDPLWKAQTTVGETIAKVRTLLAASQISPKDIKNRSELVPYESRLKALAKEITDEPDPQRKERLKLLFQNLYNLKQIKSVKINLSPASQVLLSRMVDALERLELQFTRIIFTAEEAFAVLGNQQQFLKDYIQVVRGLIDIEDLAGWLAGGGTSESIATVEGLLKQFQDLNSTVGNFETAMNEYSEKLLENIEEHSQKIETNLQGISPVSTTSNAELDKLISRYAEKED